MFHFSVKREKEMTCSKLVIGDWGIGDKFLPLVMPEIGINLEDHLK
jgi:hypothetical protein